MIAFNFVGKLFSEPTIMKDVRNIFANSPIKFSQVVLEVTERDPIVNFTKTRQTIAALQGLGVRIAIDDVGTGLAGFITCSSLVSTSSRSTSYLLMPSAPIATRRPSSMDVVAEGVKNFEQGMHLRTLGVRLAQGYVFAPPLPGSSFLQLVEAIDPLQAGAADATERKTKRGGLAAAQLKRHAGGTS